MNNSFKDKNVDGRLCPWIVKADAARQTEVGSLK
jgi:hypothetical protein